MIFLGGSMSLVEGVFTNGEGKMIPYKKGYAIFKDGNRQPELYTLDEDVYSKVYGKLKFGEDYELLFRQYYGKYKIADIQHKQ